MRTNRLDGISVDLARRTARVGAGISWGRLQAAVGAHGLTGLMGSSPAVGVTGYVLGGGLSWFARMYGWAADSVIAFDVVDAEGRTLHVTASAEPDLFWALRGGGGDFALVTGLELDLKSVPALYGGQLLWPADRAPQVMAAFQEITATAPRELTLWWNLMRIPSRPTLVGIDTTYLGDGEHARRLLAPLDSIDGRISDTRRELSLTDLGSITAEPTKPSPARSHTELLTRLDVSVVQNLLTMPMSPLATMQIRHLGGAIAQQSSTPPSALVEPYYITFVAAQTTPAAAAGIDASLQTHLAALGETRSSRTPFTFLTRGQTAADAIPADALSRLRKIKGRSDPHGIFHSNFPVG